MTDPTPEQAAARIAAFQAAWRSGAPNSDVGRIAWLVNTHHQLTDDDLTAVHTDRAQLRQQLADARRLLARAEAHLAVTHTQLKHHDTMGAGYTCAGCQLREQLADQN